MAKTKQKKKETIRRPTRVNTLLKSIWEDLSDPASYSTAHKLWKAAAEKKPNISLESVEDWLSGQPSYTLHRRVVSKFPRRKVLTRGLNYQWQADLMEVQEIAPENKGNRYLLAIIDCFSRFAFVVPLKNKKSETVAKAFKSVLSKNRKPLKLQTDQGTEFTGAPFQQMCKENSIHHFHTYQDVKAQIVERFNKTFKMKIVKFFRSKKTLNYLGVLPTVVSTYNKSPHSALGVNVAPIDVTKKNEKAIHDYQYGEYLARTLPVPRFKINDFVRLSVYRKTFKRGYEKNFTEEIFIVSDVYPTNPRTYAIRDKDNEILSGAVYEQELIKVKENDGEY